MEQFRRHLKTKPVFIGILISVFKFTTISYLAGNCFVNETACGSANILSTGICTCLWEGNCVIDSKCVLNGASESACETCQPSLEVSRLSRTPSLGYCLIQDSCISDYEYNPSDSCEVLWLS